VTDLAVVAQDPRFGRGVLAQLEAFWRGAAGLGRHPNLLYLRRRSLARVDLSGSPLDLPGLPGALSAVDALHQTVDARRLVPHLRPARSVWVVSTTASYGYPAARSGRPYACWIGTALADEHEARRRGLPPARRLALAANAPVLRQLERTVLRGAARVYATTPATVDRLAAVAGLDAGAVGVLPIPVDAARFSPLPDDVWLAGLAAPTLVFVGAASDPRKNVGLLLDAFAMLRERVPMARLRLVGPPPAATLPAGVEATGHVASTPDYLRDAALFVLPSLQEGFGVVAAEALACGVPVLTTPSGGPEHLVRASAGGVVLEGFDPGELAEAAAGLLESTDTLAQMRAAGRNYIVREHSPERFQALLAEAFQDLDGD
jgi:glycosyltransferase involved in cell wall biosynthesis